MAEFFTNKTILITGGTGSWGTELIQQILQNHKPKEIRVFSRGEHKQVSMKRAFSGVDCITYIIGDVRDKDRLTTAMRGVDYVFHLAALKHVPVCEENPYESVLTNIVGTQNVVDAAIANDVEKVIDISTDKAVDPFNLYGVCKSVGEKLMIAANKNGKTKFICIRGGNVLGTAGSVVPLFKEQILRAGKITITDERMTRFMMTLKEAIGLIFEATQKGVGGEIFVMRMPALTVPDLADVMIEQIGKFRKDGKDVTRSTIGIRPGEKLHEVLVSRYEAPYTIAMGEHYYVILPNIMHDELVSHYGKPEGMEEFTSENAKRLTKEEIVTMLETDGWLSPMHVDDAWIGGLDKDKLLTFFEQEGWQK